MKRQRFKFKLLAFFLFALFALLGTYGMHSIALYGNRWFTYAKNPRVRAQKQNVVPGDILDRSGVVLATSSVSEDGTVTRVYQSDEAARRAIVHLLGDSDGQVANGVESFQTAYLYGFQTGIWERIQALVTGQKRHGDNVTLTVDSSLCTSILQSFQRRAPGKAGAAVVMNYKTGEVLGMVSLPTFDPMSSSAVSASSNAYWNRVTQNPYTPGSTFKLVTAAAQLRVNPSAQTMQVNCTGNLTVDGQVIHDYGSASHGAIDLKTAFMRSCNNAFAQYALSMGDKALREAAESFGFNDNFLFRDLVVENSVYPTTSRNNFNIAMSGFGQSAITATPMHLCLLAAAVANKGVMMEPVLIDRVASPSGVTRYTRSSRVYRTAMTERQAALLAEYMRAVVTSGTGTRAAIGTADTPAEPISGLILPPESLFISFASSTPPAVPMPNATMPIAMISSVRTVRKVEAVAVAPTVMPRKIVTIFISSFCIVLFRRSVTPHSFARLPSIRQPTSGAADGSSSATRMVTTMGKIIFCVLVAGLSCSMTILRSFSVVRARIIGG